MSNVQESVEPGEIDVSETPVLAISGSIAAQFVEKNVEEGRKTQIPSLNLVIEQQPHHTPTQKVSWITKFRQRSNLRRYSKKRKVLKE